MSDELTAMLNDTALIAKIKAFLDARCTGTIELNIKEGSISAYKIVDSGRIDQKPVANC